jgi:hypothetical protein
MNAIQHALNELKHVIPMPILREAFLNDLIRQETWGRRHAPVVSIDHVIRDKVIEGRVIPGMNLISGQRELIPLFGLIQEQQPDWSLVVQIPKDRTDGRSITAVYAMVTGTPTGALGGSVSMQSGGYGSGLIDALRANQLSRAQMPLMSDANIQLIGDNTLLIRSPLRLAGTLYLDCQLENNNTLSHIPASAWKHFKKLVEYAVKAYIYNNINISMDEAQISGGMSLGTFRSVVDGYSDANELYEEQMNKWQKVAILSDPLSHLDHIQSIVGGLL